MDHAVSHLRKSCYLELRKIANMRSYLSDAATLKLVLSLVISKLIYCNSLFYNMSLENIHKLQLIQNHAARLLKRASFCILCTQHHLARSLKNTTLTIICMLMTLSCINLSLFQIFNF